jgi:hypothetical protein
VTSLAPITVCVAARPVTVKAIVPGAGLPVTFVVTTASLLELADRRCQSVAASSFAAASPSALNRALRSVNSFTVSRS